MTREQDIFSCDQCPVREWTEIWWTVDDDEVVIGVQSLYGLSG